jgi:hypothetical protein
METITIKIHYQNNLIDYTLEGEMIGDYAVHPVLHGRMMNGKLQHGPHYTISTPGTYTVTAFKLKDNARACALALSEVVTAAELERLAFAVSGKKQLKDPVLSVAIKQINNYLEQDKQGKS